MELQKKSLKWNSWLLKSDYFCLGVSLKAAFYWKLFKIGIQSAKDIRKDEPILQVWGSAPGLPTLPVFRVVLIHTEASVYAAFPPFENWPKDGILWIDLLSWRRISSEEFDRFDEILLRFKYAERTVIHMKTKTMDKIWNIHALSTPIAMWLI